MGGVERIIAWGGLIAIIIAAVGVAVGAGTTTVAVQPTAETIDTGTNTTVEIVLDEATDGVGSIDIELDVADGAVANVTNASVAGNPNTVQNTIESNSVRLIATGMDTADTGSVTLATVTLTGESTGTSALDVTVGAIGDESGSSYNITQVSNGELTVEDTATATETDEDSGGGSSGDVSSGDVSSGGGGSGDVSSGGGGSADIDIVATQRNATSVQVGDTVETTVDLENTGSGDGHRDISYRVNGTIVEDEHVSLDSGERTTITFTTTFESVGEYDIAVAQATTVGTVTVTPSESDPATSSGDGGSVSTETPTATPTPLETDTTGQSASPTERSPTLTDNSTASFEAGGSLVIGVGVVGILTLVGGLLLYRA